MRDPARRSGRTGSGHGFPRARRRVLAAVVTTVLVGSTAVTATAQPEVASYGPALDVADAREVNWDPTPLCEVPPGADPAYVSTIAGDPDPDPKATPAIVSWMFDDRATNEAVGRVDEWIRTSTDWVGVRPDLVEQRMVVTIEPSVDHEPIVEELSRIAAGDLEIMIRPACFGDAEVRGVFDALEDGSWRLEAEAGADVGGSGDRDRPISVLRELTGALHVYVTDLDRPAMDRWASALGPRVVVEEGRLGLQSRMNDGSPHWGGAALGAYNQPTCTAGFSVKIDGTYWMATAGHCSFPTYVYSGTEYVGVTNAHSLNPHVFYPNTDLQVLGSGVETYRNRIHVDPCCPTVRWVTAARDAKMSDNICISGMVTKAQCGWLLQEWDPSLSFVNYGVQNYSTTRLQLAWHPNGRQTSSGDSGAPWYVRSGSSNAIIVGLHVGVRDLPQYPISFKVSEIETALGPGNGVSLSGYGSSW